MPTVHVKETESFDGALRRFKRACEKAGIPGRLRQIEFYEKPTSQRNRKHAAAIKRWQKRLQKEQEIQLRSRAKYPKVATASDLLEQSKQTKTADE